MEKNCVFCGSPIYPDNISYKIGGYFICYRCASTQTIRNLNSVLNDELRVDPNIVDVTDSSLAGQTDSGHGDDNGVESITCAEDMYEYEAKRLSKEDYFNKYVSDIMDKDGPSAMARDIWEKAHTDSSLAGQTDSGVSAGTASKEFPLPNGCNKDCPYFPYDTCGHYYGEIHECMLGEENTDIVDPEDDTPEYWGDAENMSEDDYLSKYVDNQDALEYWTKVHPDSIS